MRRHSTVEILWLFHLTKLSSALEISSDMNDSTLSSNDKLPKSQRFIIILTAPPASTIDYSSAILTLLPPGYKKVLPIPRIILCQTL